MPVVNDPDGQPQTVVKEGGKGYALTNSVIETQSHHINHATGKVWTYSFFDIDPAGAGDNFLHIINSNGQAYAITTLSVWSSTTVGLMKIIKATGTAAFVTGSPVSAITRNTGENPTSNLVVTTDTNITGIADAGVLEAINLAVLDTNYPVLQPADILIKQGGQILFQWEPASGVISGTITVTELAC